MTGRVRFNHMELTFARGALTPELRADIDAFYGGIFGWKGVDTEVVGQLCHILLTGESGDFILLAESGKPIASPGYDHLGLLHGTRGEVDEKLAACREFQAGDPRVEIKDYDDLVTGDLVVRAFYVRYLLPIWFDVQCMERAGAAVPVP